MPSFFIYSSLNKSEELCMTKVNVKKFEQDRNGNLYATNESVSYEIEPIKPRQFGALAKVFNETQKDLQSNDEFKKTVQNIFGNYADGFTFEDIMRSEDFNVFTILDAIGFLVENAPKRLAQVMAIASGIDEHILQEQDADTYFEVIEAIIETNDIEKVITRIKKIQEKLGKTLSFLRPQQEDELMNNRQA